MDHTELERQVTRRVLIGCVTGLLFFGILVGGTASGTVQQGQQATVRVSAICAGNMESDRVRAVACVLATINSKDAGH